MDGWVDGWTDGRTDGRTAGRTDGRKSGYLSRTFATRFDKNDVQIFIGNHDSFRSKNYFTEKKYLFLKKLIITSFFTQSNNFFGIKRSSVF